MQRLAAAILAKAKHSDGDQALLDLAYHAVAKCMGMDGLLFAERNHLAKAGEALKAAGAAASEEATVDTAHNPAARPPMVRAPAAFDSGHRSPVDGAANPLAGHGAGVLEMITTALGKRAQSGQALMDVAHDCIGKLTDGGCCSTADQGGRASFARDVGPPRQRSRSSRRRRSAMRRRGIDRRDGSGSSAVRPR